MRHCLTNIFIVYYFIHIGKCDDSYGSKRSKLLEKELNFALGGDIVLTDKEDVVNKCLMTHKLRELEYAFDSPQFFNFSHHYFKYKDGIKNSPVYKIIKDMPKGAILHIHDMGILSPDYLMGITYMDNLYICNDTQGIKLQFSASVPLLKCSGKWNLIKKERNFSQNITEYDLNIRKHFTLVVDNPEEVYPSIRETWGTFMKYFITVSSMLSYRPVWEQYFYDALKLLKEDNIMYVEVRTVLPNLYELDGTVYDQSLTAKAYRKSIKKFLKENPDFIGAKIIFAPSRMVDKNQVNYYLKTAKQIKEDVPDIFAGFDLVGQEDLGNPLIDFVPQLDAAKTEFNYFFHAGETDWYGTSTDDNLVDAILLGAKRIGHAYALPKHPVLADSVIKNDIGIEVNVISNTVLSLLQDVRNHPLTYFFANNLPLVLSSDDPGAWEADPVTDDFYVAFVGVASKKSDIRLLKKLAMNSLKYSALNDIEKPKALKLFNISWNRFIENFICDKY